MTSAEREQLIEETLAHYRALLERRLAENPETLAEIEQTVEEISPEMDRILEQRILDILPPEANQASCPQCQATARFRRVLSRQVLTSHGARTVACRYYYCAACGHGFAPREVRLALPATRVSPQVQAWIASRSARLPFAEVAEDLAELRALKVSVSTIERTAVAVGQALRAAEDTGHAPGATVTPTAPGRPRLYLSMDGIFAPLREPWKKDGSAGKLHCRFGECKVGLAYVAEAGPDGDCGVVWRAYTATLDQVEAFTPHMVGLAPRAGVATAAEVVVIADGAPWIWNLCTREFPQAIQVLDYYHMTQHLYAVAHARYPGDAASATAWVHTCQAFLEQDQVEHVLGTLQNWEPESTADREVRDREYTFFANHAERMRYGTYRKRGFHIGSGVMEASCKRVVAQRLDEAGMHWREETADASAGLRAAWLSTQRPDLRLFSGFAAA